MAAKRPQLKRPGITATGRQWQTIEALRRDGWFVLEADPTRWPKEEVERVSAALDRLAPHEPTVADTAGPGMPCYWCGAVPPCRPWRHQ